NRVFAATAFDTVHSQLVLFGGADIFSGQPINDTWTWDGTTWTRQNPATKPPARWGAAMAYDSLHGQVGMFGGYSEGSANTTTHQTNTDAAQLNDIWTWDGTNWTQQIPALSPPARYFHSMAFDAQIGAVVLFGGSTTSPSNFFHNS